MYKLRPPSQMTFCCSMMYLVFSFTFSNCFQRQIVAIAPHCGEPVLSVVVLDVLSPLS